GLGLSAMVIADSGLRQKMADVLESFHMPQSNPFSVTGFEAGYRHGGPWLDQLMVYLQANRDFVVSQVAQRLPGIKVSAPEGTYLMWLDCRALGLEDTGLKRLFVQQAGVGMNPGVTFGADGSGFMRLNIGCPRATLEQVIGRIQAALGAQQ
ncbi:MAG TPA: aminotransferase, partial [Marinobacter sp.]|nr:aminotransferase [Marinobacter sp.]